MKCRGQITIPSVALESLAPVQTVLQTLTSLVDKVCLPRPWVPTSSISPSHKEPPMWAHRLSLAVNIRIFNVIQNVPIRHSASLYRSATEQDKFKHPRCQSEELTSVPENCNLLVPEFSNARVPEVFTWTFPVRLRTAWSQLGVYEVGISRVSSGLRASCGRLCSHELRV